MLKRKLFEFVAVAVLSCLFFPAQAECPSIVDIINTFNKNGLLPKGWMLVAYTGNQIDKNFYFAKASWDADSTYDKNANGIIECEYYSRYKTNPGFLIIETAYSLPAPHGPHWRPLATATRTAVCKPANWNIASCGF